MRCLGALVGLCAALSAPVARADNAAAATDATSRAVATAPDDRAGGAETVVLNFAGDVAWPDGWGGIGTIDELQHRLFAQVEPLLSTGDVNFANLECPFTTASAVVQKTYPITCHPKRLAYAVDAGFNLFSLANNHSMDAGGQGITDTHALMEQTSTAERPLWWAGTGETPEQANAPVVFTPPGKRTRFAMFALGNSAPVSKVGSFNAPDLPDRIAAAAEQVDVVIVSVHYGPEYVHVPSQRTVERYHALIDAGATIVVAHHPHVVQGVERYGRGIIFYSMGNFSFGSKTRRHLETGARLYSLLGRVTLTGGAVDEVELVPLYVNNSKPWPLGDETLDPRHGTPQLLRGAFAQYALDELEQFTAAVPTETPTPLVRLGDRLFVDLGDGGPALADRAARLHEQIHAYIGAEATGAEPRAATEAEKSWENRAGTPAHIAPPAKSASKRAAKKRRGKRARKAARKARAQKSKRRKAKAKRRR